MNTEEQAMAISKRIGSLLEPNKGVLRITIYEPAQTLEVKVKNFFTEFNARGFSGYLITFTNDITKLTTYDVYNIRDVS